MNRRMVKIATVLLLALATSSFSQYYFGRNKIQYNQFDWHILRTEHFDIYYYPQMRELAEIGAAYAEKTYDSLTTKFNHHILERIPLIFYATHAHFQETNTIPYVIPEGVGGFFEFLKGRVVLPANGSMSQFKHVLRHELVHVFTFSKINRVTKDHKQQGHPGLPLWFIEGLAEFWSEGWDSQAEMFLRDAVLNDYLFTPSTLYQISGSFLMYKMGQGLLRYIAETYGDEKILELCENIWISKQFSEVMRATLGKDYKDLDREWSYSLQKDFFPLLKDHDSATMVTQQLTHQGFNIKPAFYSDGEKDHLVFISNRTGYSNIYTMSLPTDESARKETDLQILVEGEKSPEFESIHLLSSNIDINRAGELAFTSKSGETDHLYIYHLASRDIIGRHHFPDLVSIYSPSWSPLGNQVVFSGLAFSGKSDLYLYDFKIGQLTRLMDDYFDDIDPAWSPDGKEIAFSSDRGGAGENGFYNLFLYNLENGLIRYATFGEFNDKNPSWSPDGRFLTFSSDRSGTPNIWCIKSGSEPQSDLIASVAGASALLTGSTDSHSTAISALDPAHSMKQVTFFTTGAYDPEWSDDGDLFFTAFEKLAFHIRRLKNVETLFESTPVTPSDSLEHTEQPWAFEREEGGDGPSGIRYRPKYSLDIAQSQITQDPIFGTSGGMQLAISDMLGNSQYFFLLYNNARTKSEFLSSFNVAVSRVSLSQRTNYAIGFYHFAGRYYNLYDFWFWERRYGGFAAVSYPLSRFNRVEASLNARYSDKEWFSRDYRRKALLVSNFVSYIKDNSIWGATGPMDGERINLTIGNTRDVAHANVNFITAIVDYRRYFRISTPVTHAVRVWTQINEGKESTPFFMGGSWDLRGYRLWRIWGTKLALVSNELRFPFIDRFMINFPIGGLALSSVRGALFCDMGNAWDKNLDHLLGSTGFGVRFRFGGYLVLRFDVGRKFMISDLNRFYNVADYHFDKKWFTQFFFGWDF